MLVREAANVPALVTSKVFVSADSSKRFCKAWPGSGRSDSVVEPTSVLDIRSPSPSSTLSSSLACSCEGGLGSIESGTVAVSGLFCEGASEGQLPDCTSLLASNEGSVWSIAAGDDGRAASENEIVGTWQAGSQEVRQGWERNIGHTGNASVEGAHKNAEGPSGGMKGVGILVGSNVGAVLSGSVIQAASTVGEKQAQGGLGGRDNLCKVEHFTFSSANSVSNFLGGEGKGVLLGEGAEKTVKDEVLADGSLEACVMSCRKRDREDLGEVVQRLGAGSGVGGLKIESGEWLADWNEFQVGEAAPPVGEKVAPSQVAPSQLEDLDDIFVGSPAPPPAEFWLSENPPAAQQAQSYGGTVARSNDDAGSNNSAARVQLDLYEAVQAELLYRGGGGSADVTVGSSSPTTFSPVPALSRSRAAPLTSQLDLPFTFRAAALPFHRLPFSGVAPPLAPFAPEFLDKLPTPPSPASGLLNATYSPSPPHFSPQMQFQELLNFPRPSTYKYPPQAQPLGLPKHEYFPPNAEFADPKLWQMRVLVGDGASKVAPSGPKWQLKPETGWQVERLSAGPFRVPALNQHSIPAEQPLRRHAMPEHVGRRVRLEELLLAERQLLAASETVGLGDLGMAQAILARLNQQISSRGQQPSQRVIFHFKEALAERIAAGSSWSFQQANSNSPLDIINKISAYKSFCEVSPIPQFAHFTANQAILDAMESEDCIHLIDFELGFGGQWASFMQEISQRSRGPPELKITTMGTDSLEMRLAKENLLHFAKDIGLILHFNALPVKKMECLKASMFKKREREAVAVNFGFGLNRLMSDFSSTDALSGFFQLIRGLSPKVVAVVDSECEFEGSSHLFDSLQFYSCLFESLQSSKLPIETVFNVESLIFAPKIADVVNARRLNTAESLPPWRILLQKAGFSAFPFGNAAESQAGCLVKNPANSGFNYLKQHGTLLLGWYNKTLVSASAWVPNYSPH